VLAVLGGVAGVLLAMWLIGPILAMSPADLGVAGAVTVDRTVLAVRSGGFDRGGSALRAGPAHQLASADVARRPQAGRARGSSPRQRRIRAALVVSEVRLVAVLSSAPA